MTLGIRRRSTDNTCTASRYSFLALCVLCLCGSRAAAQVPHERDVQGEGITIEEAVLLAGERLAGRIPSLKGSAAHLVESKEEDILSVSTSGDDTGNSSEPGDSGLAGTHGPSGLDSAADEGADGLGEMEGTDPGATEAVTKTNSTSSGVLPTPHDENASPAHESDAHTPNSTVPRVTKCFYGHNFCQCRRRVASDMASGCLASVGVDSATGRKLCRHVDCLPEQGYVCDCEGDELCRNDRTRERLALTVDANESPAMESSSPSQHFFYCDSKMILGTVEPVEEADSLDSFTALELRNKVSEHTAAWNATHCACTARINIVSHTTCFDLIRAAPATGGLEADLCTARSCRIDPDEMVCDMMIGTSLCERFLVYAERYRESPGAPWPSDAEEYTTRLINDQAVTKVVPCHKEGGATERPRCVSSCP